jgi:hypothetical protein
MNGPGSRAAIYGPEPWRTNRNVVFSHWDLWFCVVAVADHDGDLDQLAAAIEGDRRSFASSMAEGKLSHLDDVRRRLADIGIDAAALAGSAADDQRVRNKARTKVLEQGLYSRDLTDAMRQTPRERLYDRALRGRRQRFPVSPEPFYAPLARLEPRPSRQASRGRPGRQLPRTKSGVERPSGGCSYWGAKVRAAAAPRVLSVDFERPTLDAEWGKASVNPPSALTLGCVALRSRRAASADECSPSIAIVPTEWSGRSQVGESMRPVRPSRTLG